MIEPGVAEDVCQITTLVHLVLARVGTEDAFLQANTYRQDITSRRRKWMSGLFCYGGSEFPPSLVCFVVVTSLKRDRQLPRSTLAATRGTRYSWCALYCK
jgi:hypothetical protein